MLEIQNLTKVKVSEKSLQKIAEILFQKEKVKDAVVSVVLLPAKRAQELNKIYRKKTYVPNVLSFAEPELGLGEIVLCPEQIGKDAKKYGILFEQELARVFTHGLLHLLGYNHKKIEDYEATNYFWA